MTIARPQSAQNKLYEDFRKNIEPVMKLIEKRVAEAAKLTEYKPLVNRRYHPEQLIHYVNLLQPHEVVPYLTAHELAISSITNPSTLVELIKTTMLKVLDQKSNNPVQNLEMIFNLFLPYVLAPSFKCADLMKLIGELNLAFANNRNDIKNRILETIFPFAFVFMSKNIISEDELLEMINLLSQTDVRFLLLISFLHSRGEFQSPDKVISIIKASIVPSLHNFDETDLKQTDEVVMKYTELREKLESNNQLLDFMLTCTLQHLKVKFTTPDLVNLLNLFNEPLKNSANQSRQKKFKLQLAEHMRAAIHDDIELNLVLNLLHVDDRVKFISDQDVMWARVDRILECKLAFLSGKKCKEATNYNFLHKTDKNITISIFKRAKLTLDETDEVTPAPATASP